MKKRIQKFFEWFTDGYDESVFRKNSEEINAHNVRFLLFFNTLTLVILVLAFLSSFLAEYVISVRWVFGIAVLFNLAELVFDQFGVKKKPGWTLCAIYLCMTKIYCLCVFLGIYFNRESPAVSFYPLMIILSILFIMKPLTLDLYHLLVSVIFCWTAYQEKEWGIASGDIYCCIIFYILQIVISFWIIKLRISYIRNEQLLILQRDTDILTELPNRRYFNAYVSKIFQKNRENGKLSILMMDVDHFKAYNDCKGHIEGDQCLALVGRALKELGKKEGVQFARYGGEEFVAVDDIHSADEIMDFAQRIVKQVYDLNLPHESTQFKRLTISVGYAVQEHVNAEDYVELLQAADLALYMAKKNGRNRIAGYRG